MLSYLPKAWRVCVLGGASGWYALIPAKASDILTRSVSEVNCANGTHTSATEICGHTSLFGSKAGQ
jgi:hypothetical protein